MVTITHVGIDIHRERRAWYHECSILNDRMRVKRFGVNVFNFEVVT